MIVAISTYVRYEMQDENGETRRDRNEKFGASSPSVNIPLDGMHLWVTYWKISNSVVRVSDGICRPIAPSEIHSWMTINCEILYHHEIEMLQAMDTAYCDEMNVELNAYREREQERREQEAAAARRTKNTRAK